MGSGEPHPCYRDKACERSEKLPLSLPQHVRIATSVGSIVLSEFKYISPRQPDPGPLLCFPLTFTSPPRDFHRKCGFKSVGGTCQPGPPSLQNPGE